MIDAGRAFAADTEPLKEQFVLHGMAPDFTENLKSVAQNLEGSILNYVSAKANRSVTIREFDKTLDEALNLVNRFEALVSNTMADNLSVMTAWEFARRIVQPGSSKSGPEPEVIPQVPPIPASVPAAAFSTV